MSAPYPYIFKEKPEEVAFRMAEIENAIRCMQIIKGKVDRFAEDMQKDLLDFDARLQDSAEWYDSDIVREKASLHIDNVKKSIKKLQESVSFVRGLLCEIQHDMDNRIPNE